MFGSLFGNDFGKSLWEDAGRLLDSGVTPQQIREQTQIEIESMNIAHKANMSILDYLSDNEIDYEIRRWLVNHYAILRNDPRKSQSIVNAIRRGCSVNELNNLI